MGVDSSKNQFELLTLHPERLFQDQMILANTHQYCLALEFFADIFAEQFVGHVANHVQLSQDVCQKKWSSH